jgi:hypothetical protein
LIEGGGAMQLNTLMWYAESACAWVDGFSIKASNRSENKQGVPYIDSVKELRKEIGDYLSTLDSIEHVRARAKLAIEKKLGNCQEQSAVAFIYLLDHFGINCNGIAMVGTARYDHVFLVLGVPLPRQEFATTISATLGKPPADWDASVVICDPWYNEWYEMKDFAPKMRQTLRKSSGIDTLLSNAGLGFKYVARA